MRLKQPLTMHFKMCVSLSAEFDQIWARLKIELNLHDQDLNMTYKVQIHNGIAVLGYLGRGKVKINATGFPHPSSAKRAAEAYIKKNPGHKYVILPWDRYKDNNYV